MSSDTISVEVPDIGDFEDVPVIEILVAPGDDVAPDDPLLTLESEKAAMDVPAPSAGVVSELHVAVGDKVSQGTLVLTLAASGAPDAEAADASQTGAADEPEAEAANEPETEAGETPAEEESPPAAETPPAREPEPETEGTPPIYASPSVRRLARERGIDLSAIDGSGRKGRITKADVGERGPGTASPAGPGSGLDLPPWPSVDFEQFGPVERVARSRIEKISAPSLARNWMMIPHVTHNDEADITELESWRAQLNQEQSGEGVKVTMVALLVLACAATLREFPRLNSSLDGDELVLKRYCNIGFAADTPMGLVVPVIKDADHKGLIQVAGELAELSGKARAGKLAPADMQGCTFTISSLGGIGGTSFTPIVNAPEVAILGVTRAAIKPVWNQAGNTFLPRLMLPLSLSYDHRVIDGAGAARFVVHLAAVLSDLRRALL